MSAQSHTPTPWTPYGGHCIAFEGELICKMERGFHRDLPIQSNRALILEAVNSYAAHKTRIKALEEALRKIATGDHPCENCERGDKTAADIAKSALASA